MKNSHRRLPLKDEMIIAGGQLFRWRSFLPLLFLPVFVLALDHFRYPRGSEALDNLWDIFCVSVAAVGVLLRFLTVGFVPAHSSGRNTRRQKANSLNVTGMYSVVRHPLYLGNGFIWLGLALFTHTWWLVLIATLAFWLYYERIMLAEEHYLEELFGESFVVWAARTPTFAPDPRGWERPALPFSWKSALARENSTFLSTILAFFTLELVGDYFAGRMPHVDMWWLLLVAAGIGAYTVLRWMKKRGQLSVVGR